MKKLLLSLTFIFAVSATAQAQVYSNTVGMVKTTLPANTYKILSLQLSGSDTGVTLGEAFGEVADQTVIYVWTNSEYTDYTYHTAGNGWYDSSFLSADNVNIPQGSSIWVKVAGAETTLVHSGTVPETDTVTVNFAQGFNLISVPYPVAMTLGDLDTRDISDLDVIYIWNGSGYTDYTYFVAGNGWYDSSFNSAATVSIPAGVGVWLQAGKLTGSIVFTKPY